MGQKDLKLLVGGGGIFFEDKRGNCLMNKVLVEVGVVGGILG